MKRIHRDDQRGFTIIELMIATAVLSTILLLVTVLMINIGSLYYKGINQARVQDNVRSVNGEISQHLQLGDYVNASPTAQKGPNGEQAYCVGSLRYTYITGVQIGQPAPGSSAPIFRHILWRDDNPAPGTCSVTNNPSNPSDHTNLVDLTKTVPDGQAEGYLSRQLHGSELIAPNSRLINFSIKSLSPAGGSPYKIDAGVAYGDNDLLCVPSIAGSCTTDAAMATLPQYQTGKLLCKGQKADEFCATAQLSTNVVRRLP